MSQSISLPITYKIAASCDVPWSAMTGDDRVRRCDQCQLDVYNLADLSREEAVALIEKRGGRFCGRAWARADGTLIFQNCPVGLLRLRRRLAKMMGAIAAVFTFLLGGTTLLGARTGSSAAVAEWEPFSRLVQWINPPQPLRYLAGEICPAPTSRRAPGSVSMPPSPESTEVGEN